METVSEHADVLIVGAGMAGASVAAELAGNHRVIVLEREDHPGYHSTGRSAAMYIRNYGNEPVRLLTAASFELLHRPDADFSEQSFLSPRGVMHLATAAQQESLGKLAILAGMVPLTASEARQRIPLLREGAIVGGFLEEDAMDIDVHGLHAAYLRRLRRAGGRLVCRAGVESLTRISGHWQVKTPSGLFQAPVVVNAAGAWADQLALLAGVQPLGLTPKRRTVAIVAPPDGVDVRNWPMVLGASEEVYFRPEVGKLLVSPADATPVPASDVQPEEWDVAVAIHRLEEILDLEITRVEHRWAGLRTFAADGSPVVGWDPGMEGFFWVAGQGGYGIQMAPALARLAASRVSGQPKPSDLDGLDLSLVEVQRLYGMDDPSEVEG